MSRSTKINMKPSRAKGKSEALERAVLSPTTAGKGQDYKKALFVLPITDISWLDAEIERFRRSTKRRTNKSQVVQVALELLRKRGGYESALKEISER